MGKTLFWQIKYLAEIKGEGNMNGFCADMIVAAIKKDSTPDFLAATEKFENAESESENGLVPNGMRLFMWLMPHKKRE